MNPVYLVRVENQSQLAIDAKLEQWPGMANKISLDGARLGSGDSAELGSKDVPLFERVYILIRSPYQEGQELEFSQFYRVRAGETVVRVSGGQRGFEQDWNSLEITVIRE